MEATKPNKPLRSPPAWLLALGKSALPSSILVRGTEYGHVQTFKHDFFAATGLYEGPAGRVVLKVGRRSSLFGLPMDWVGGLLMRHEARMYRLTQSIAGVPRLVGTWGTTGLVHEYIEGRPLSKSLAVDDAFFPRLSSMLDAMHARSAAYVDLEKPENILLGKDGAPYLFDFQISWHVPRNRGGDTWPCRMILDVLRASDRYHLFKHWRRMRPDQLPGAGEGRAPVWIRWHRAVFRPLTLLRRQILVWMGTRSSVKVRSPG